MHVLGLIPARGGSKGIPSKNIKPFAGRPLIAWTIDAALNSTRLADVVVSTNDATIGEVARRYGAKTPFVRPEELARDDTPGVEPALHALTMLPEFDAVILQCLAKARDQRPATADELRQQLRTLPEWKQWTEEQSKRWWDMHRPSGQRRAMATGQ